MVITYNQIIKEFNDFADAHKQIETFGNGDLWEIAERNQLLDFNYPLLWVADQPATMGDGTFTWNFQILTMDLVNKNEDNENDVKSDMIQVLLDLLGYLEQKFNTTTNNVDWTKIQLVRAGNLTSFTERFEDDVTGWGMGLGLKIPFKYSDCNLPIT